MSVHVVARISAPRFDEKERQFTQSNKTVIGFRVYEIGLVW